MITSFCHLACCDGVCGNGSVQVLMFTNAIRLSALDIVITAALVVAFSFAWSLRHNHLENQLDFDRRRIERGRQFFVVASILAVAMTAYEKCPGDLICTAFGVFVGFSAAFFGGIIFCLPVNILWRLWREFLPSISRLSPGSVARALPVVALWLAGIAGFFALIAMVVDKAPMPNGTLAELLQTHFIKVVFWAVIGLALYILWTSKKPYAVIMGGLLLSIFTIAIAGGVAGLLWSMTHFEISFFVGGLAGGGMGLLYFTRAPE